MKLKETQGILAVRELDDFHARLFHFLDIAVDRMQKT